VIVIVIVVVTRDEVRSGRSRLLHAGLTGAADAEEEGKGEAKTYEPDMLHLKTYCLGSTLIARAK
jgi:hypothetical protein